MYDTGGREHSEQCNILLQFPASFVGSFQSSRAGSENPTFLPPDVRQHQPPQFSHNIIIAITEQFLDEFQTLTRLVRYYLIRVASSVLC